MKLRKYGEKPYKIAVVHGGPGAAGSVKPLCEELSKFCGVLEPLQTEMSVHGQLDELKSFWCFPWHIIYVYTYSFFNFGG